MTTIVPLFADSKGVLSAVGAGIWLLKMLRRQPGFTEEKWRPSLARHFEDNELGQRQIKNQMELFKFLLSYSSSIFDVLEATHLKGDMIFQEDGVSVKKSYAEILREVDEFFNILISMLAFRISNQKLAEEAAQLLCQTFSAPGGHTELRLKLMQSLYNIFSPTFPSRSYVFLAILDYAIKTNQFSSLLPYVKYLNEWMKDWNLSDEQKRKVFLSLYYELKELGKSEEAFDYLKRYAELLQDAPLSVIADPAVMVGAMELAKNAIEIPNVVYFDDILRYNIIQQLANTENAVMFKLIQIFLDGSPKQLEAFREKYPTAFETYGFNYEHCLEKLSLLTVASLCSEVHELPIDKICQTLELPEHAAEELVVKAIGQGLLDGKIDQMNKLVLVRHGMQRVFGRPQWESLREQLVNWEQNVAGLLTSL